MSKILDDMRADFTAQLKAIVEDPIEAETSARNEACAKFSGLVSEIIAVSSRAKQAAGAIGGDGKVRIRQAITVIEKISRLSKPTVLQYEEASVVLRRTIQTLPGRSTDFNGKFADQLSYVARKSSGIADIVHELRAKSTTVTSSRKIQ